MWLQTGEHPRTGALALGVGGGKGQELLSNPPSANVSVNSGISNTRPFPSVTHIVAPHSQVPEPFFVRRVAAPTWGEGGAALFCASLRQKKQTKTHQDELVCLALKGF